MRSVTIAQEVTIHGTTFWGRQGRLLLRPAGRPGWYWRVDGEALPLSPELLVLKKQRLALRYGGHFLDIVEHFLFLRFFGLDGIEFSVEGGIPYDGCASTMYEAILPHLVAFGELRLVQVSDCEVSGKKMLAFTPSIHIFPGPKLLRITGFIDHKGIGSGHFTFDVGDDVAFRNVVRARALGWRFGHHAAAKLASQLLRWPHYDHIQWPHDKSNSPQNIALQTAQHQVLDFLGALAATVKAGTIPTGLVVSKYAGHKLAYELIQKMKANEMLQRT